MRGFKVVVILPEGRRSHFVPDLPNNFSGAKAAVDKICKLYAQRGLVVSPTANYFDEDRALVLPPKGHLAELKSQERCFCGFWKRGECGSCPDELSFASNKMAKTL